jgi:hypothetical protein
MAGVNRAIRSTVGAAERRRSTTRPVSRVAPTVIAGLALDGEATAVSSLLRLRGGDAAGAQIRPRRRWRRTSVIFIR